MVFRTERAFPRACSSSKKLVERAFVRAKRNQVTIRSLRFESRPIRNPGVSRLTSGFGNRHSILCKVWNHANEHAHRDQQPFQCPQRRAPSTVSVCFKISATCRGGARRSAVIAPSAARSCWRKPRSCRAIVRCAGVGCISQDDSSNSKNRRHSTLDRRRLV
jgi:hypothetical protein